MNQSMNVIEKVQELMNNNQKNNDLTSESLIDYYQSAEPNEKEIIDNVFKLICGIRFEVILKRLGIQS